MLGGFVLVARKHIAWPLLRLFGGVCFLLASAFMFERGFGSEAGQGLPYGPGGYLALELAGAGVHGEHEPAILVRKLGNPGLWVLLALTTLIAFMLATEMAFYPAVQAFREWLDERRGEAQESVPAAIWGWTRRLFAGLWHFLRGTDITTEAPAKPVAAKPKRAPKKSKPKLETPELFDEDEDEDEEAWEYEEDEEEEPELEEEEKKTTKTSGSTRKRRTKTTNTKMRTTTRSRRTRSSPLRR